MSLLPSSPDTDAAEDAGPRVIGVDTDDADELLSALSSGTARALLTELHDDPAPPSELADRVDTSLQNTQYHLENLEAAGAVEVVDTVYSAKGREMDVYAPADQPLVIFAGEEEKGSTLRSALSRLLGAVAVLAGASLLVQSLLGGSSVPSPDVADGGDAAGGGGDEGAAADTAGGVTPTDGDAATPGLQIQSEPEATRTATETATRIAEGTPEAARTAAETTVQGVGGLPPGLVFFTGGLVALAVVAAALAVRS